METFRYPQFPSLAISIALFDNIPEPSSILALIQAAAHQGDKEKARVNYAFIDAKMITSLMHLHTAILHACLSDSHDNLRTKTIHSEILWSLCPTNNIAEALRLFGISGKTKGLILVRVDSVQSDEDAYRKNLQTEMQDLLSNSRLVRERTLQEELSLGRYADWGALRKVYKLNEDLALKELSNTAASETERRKRIDAIVCSTVATKSIQL